jgi:putative transposase
MRSMDVVELAAGMRPAGRLANPARVIQMMEAGIRVGLYSEEQIIGILKQHEAGVKRADLCREHGISAATFYGWKSKFGGMDVSEAARLRQMEDENRRLKQLVADLSLDKEMLKAVIRKNGWSLPS